MHIRFQGMDGVLALDDGGRGTAELLDVLERVLIGWHFAVEPEAGPELGEPKVIRLFRDPGGFARTSPWTEGGRVVLADPVDAVCDLLPDLERAHIAANSPLLALHAAAVEFPGGLCIFPSTHESGKSTLSVALAAAGHRVFSDDLLALEVGADGPASQNAGQCTNMGVAPGFMPCLRLPLPADLDERTRGFITAHAGPASAQFQYVLLDDDRAAPTCAPLGTRAAITRLVLLSREDGAKARLEPASDSEALKHTVLQSIGREVPALEMLDHLHGLVRTADCYILHYARVADAVSLLQERFS